MKHSTDRILVSHCGNLPRPAELDALIAGGRSQVLRRARDVRGALPVQARLALPASDHRCLPTGAANVGQRLYAHALGPGRRWPGSTRPMEADSDCLNYLRDTSEVSEADMVQLLSGTIRRVLRWPKTP